VRLKISNLFIHTKLLWTLWFKVPVDLKSSMYQSEMFLQKTVKQNFYTTKPWNSGDPVGFVCQYHPRKTQLPVGLCIIWQITSACLHNSSHQIIGTLCNFVQKTCYSLCPEIQKWKLKCIIWAWLEVGFCLIRSSWLTLDSCMLLARETAKKRVTYTSIFLTCIPVLRCIVLPSQARLFRVPYFPIRSSRSTALSYGLPSCMSVKTT